MSRLKCNEFASKLKVLRYVWDSGGSAHARYMLVCECSSLVLAPPRVRIRMKAEGGGRERSVGWSVGGKNSPTYSDKKGSIHVMTFGQPRLAP